MKEKKSKKVVKTTISNKLLILFIFIATIFMSIGYATINSVVLDINGTAFIDVDENVHITVATSGHTDSTINSFSGTMLNSTVDLTNNNTETFTITIYNNDDHTVLFDQVLRDTETSLFYDNQNITFDINGLNRYYSLVPNQSVTFTMTFHYVDNFTPSTASDKILNSYINFKFRTGYTVTYNNINTTNQNYDTVVFENNNLVVNFNGDIPYDVQVKSGNTVLTPNTNYTYSNNILTVPSVTNNITIDRYYQIVYNLDGGTNNANNPSKYLHGSSETILNPTKSGSTFDGWYDNSSFTGTAITSTSGKTGTLTLYAKWSSNPYNIATTYITSLVGDADINSTNIITVNPPTGETCTNTFAYDGTVDKNLRYVGANPCNYVKFNCDSSDNCELWRIVGVMKGIDTDPVLKLVAPLSSSTRPWNTVNNNNNWDSAALCTYLNNDYLNALNNGVISDYVLNTPWYIGKVAYNSTTPNFYSGEKGTQSSNHYIGIISPSDYGYATSGTSDSTRSICINNALSGNSITSTCYDNDYLFQGDQLYQWTITANNSGNSVIRISNGGRSTRQNIGSNYVYNYRPAVYIKSNIKINTQTGNGSSNSPYELSASN